MREIVKLIDQKGFSTYILLISDVFWYFVSFLLAYYIRNRLGVDIQPLAIYLGVIPFVLLLLIFVFYIHGLYQKKNRISQISEMYLISKSLTICLVLIMAASFLQKYDYSRGLVILFWMISLVLLNFGRIGIRLIRQHLIKRGFGHINVLIIGAGKSGRRLAQALEKYRHFGYIIKGFLDDNTRQSYGDYPNFGTSERLIATIKEQKINEVFVSDPAMAHEKILVLIHKSENQPVKFRVVSDLFEIIAGAIDITEIEGIPTIDVTAPSRTSLYAVSKRLMDIIFSALGIIIFLPFWLIIAILIKIDSPGPAFFLQERIGKNAKKFIMYKFRTMHTDLGHDAFSPKNENDRRITSVGKFLRRLSLDETPQLLNILKSDMSLVGPRPEMPFIVEKYKSWQKKRLDAKPGLTGLWQVLGRKDLPLFDNLEYDFYYIKNQSLLLDLVIIIKTILIIISGKGAY